MSLLIESPISPARIAPPKKNARRARPFRNRRPAQPDRKRGQEEAQGDNEVVCPGVLDDGHDQVPLLLVGEFHALLLEHGTQHSRQTSRERNDFAGSEEQMQAGPDKRGDLREDHEEALQISAERMEIGGEFGAHFTRDQLGMHAFTGGASGNQVSVRQCHPAEARSIQG